MKISVISITSASVLVNAIILYMLIAPIFFEMNGAHGERVNSTDNNNNNNKTTNDTQQQVIETQCKSPCPPNAEMCVEMCA